MPLDGRRQGGDVVGEGLASTQSLNALRQRPQPGQLGPNRDVGLTVRGVFFLRFCRLAVSPAASQREQ